MSAHTEARYFGHEGFELDEDGRPRKWTQPHTVVLELRTWIDGELWETTLGVVAACTTKEAAMAARKLLSGSLEVKP